MRSGSRGAGQALVEFALVVPILLLTIFGLIDVGRYVYTANALNQGAREGARYGAVTAWTEGCASASRETCIKQTTIGRLVGVPSTQVTAQCRRREFDASKDDNAKPGWTLPFSADNCKPDDLLVVSVATYPTSPPPAPLAYRFFTPVISQMLGPVQVTGTAEVVVNN